MGAEPSTAQNCREVLVSPGGCCVRFGRRRASIRSWAGLLSQGRSQPARCAHLRFGQPSGMAQWS